MKIVISKTKVGIVLKSLLIGTGLSGWMQEPVFQVNTIQRVFMALVFSAAVAVFLIIERYENH